MECTSNSSDGTRMTVQHDSHLYVTYKEVNEVIHEQRGEMLAAGPAESVSGLLRAERRAAKTARPTLP